ncbi:hypothetical protein ACSQ67_003593 [Phaseolus vulgaris]
MGSSEMDKTPKEKESKTPPPTSQEQSSTTATGTINPDWPGFQAYSPIPPHGFLASSPQAHPYMWGVQAAGAILRHHGKPASVAGHLQHIGGLATIDNCDMTLEASKCIFMFDPDHIHELEGFLYIFSCWPVKLNSLFTLFCVVAYHLYSGNGTDDDGLQFMPPYGTPPHPYVAMYPPGGIYAHPSMPPGSYPFSPFAMPSPNGIAEASGNTPGSMEADGKPPEVKEKLPIKRSKGSLGSLNMITGKNNEHGKTTGTSANGIHSKSGDSASEGEGTSEGSDANSQNTWVDYETISGVGVGRPRILEDIIKRGKDSQMKSGGRQDSFEDEPSQNGTSAYTSQNGGLSTPATVVNQNVPIIPISAGGAPGAVPGPTTNLNIGMDYWGTPAPSNIPALGRKVPSTAVAGSRDSVQSQLWLQFVTLILRLRYAENLIALMVGVEQPLAAPKALVIKHMDVLAVEAVTVPFTGVSEMKQRRLLTTTDEREIKRQRRKQSNRESARRSRLRKQAECDELAQRAEALKEENASLRSEVSRIRSDYEQLLSENTALKERLGELPANDQHVGNEAQQNGQTEGVQGGH